MNANLNGRQQSKSDKKSRDLRAQKNGAGCVHFESSSTARHSATALRGGCGLKVLSRCAYPVESNGDWCDRILRERGIVREREGAVGSAHTIRQESPGSDRL